MIKITKSIAVLGIINVVLACNSSQLVDHWKNPDIDTFEAQKVLVIGVTPNEENRKSFENRLTKTLSKNGVNAIESIVFFEKSFTSSLKSEKELVQLESELLTQGFDAILLSKVIGVEDRVSISQSFKNFDKTFSNFKEDYYKNQDIYFNDAYYEEYQIFHAESSLYCICPEKERELIWKGAIDVTEPNTVKKAIDDYIKVLVWVLKEQQLLMLNKE